MILKYRNIVLLILFLSLCGCNFSRIAIASLKSTSHFLELNSNKSIYFEPGAEEFSKEIAKYLQNSIEKIEKKFNRPFLKPVEVYICATKKSFSQFTGVPKEFKAAVTIKHVFLSAERISELTLEMQQAVLTHELTHLFLQQYLGGYNYGAKLPAWFNEGLAEYISGGAAMETVSIKEAEKFILDGNHFTPEAKGSFFFPKYNKAYGLSPHMFYRQSFMFVSYLKNIDQSKFQSFLMEITDGNNFERSFNSIYKNTIDSEWEKFILKIEENQI